MRRWLIAAVAVWAGAFTAGAAEFPRPHPRPPLPPPFFLPAPFPPEVRYFPGYASHGYPVYDPLYSIVPYPHYGGPILLPPLVIPAETLYGPEAVKRFMGVDGWGSGGGQARNARPEGERRDARGEADDEKAVPPRGTNAEAVALGRRFIAFGDAQFVKQKYPDALQRYKKAAQAAPALADAWFRQGYAYVAGGRYEQAVNAFKQGLKLDPGWPRSAFSNAVLYGDNRAAEMAHLEALAKAADQDRNNADLLLLVGIYLHFGRQPERAQPFFQRAVQLAGGDADHLQGFVAKAEN